MLGNWKMVEKDEDTCITLLRGKLEASLTRISFLEAENEQLKREIHHLSTQNALLQAPDADRRAMFRKTTQGLAGYNGLMKQMDQVNNADDSLLSENLTSRSKFSGSPAKSRSRSPRVPNPPPTPSCYSAPTNISKGTKLPSPPPPPPPPPAAALFPLSTKSTCVPLKTVGRMPEVLELYRSLTRKESKSDTKTASLTIPSSPNPREMIGEIENRSSHLLAIKSDVESQAEFINRLTREVENAAYKEISDVEAFVKWLDEELAYLIDERAVLKHFPKWPEKKADAMREAAVGYRELKSLESEVFSFRDDRRQPNSVALKRMHALQDKLERSVQNIERVRESAAKRYRDFNLPWQWMLNSGILAQLKWGSLKLAKQFIDRVVSAVKFDAFSDDEELLMQQGVRFAYRVHQFVGGFDEECKRAFQELKMSFDNPRSMST